MGHTPGPWTLHGWGDNDYEINAAEGTVCNVPGFDDDTVESNMAEHNAHLISAAPDLLEACELLLIYLGDWNDMEDETCAAARRAIAKARGQEVPNG